MQSVKAYMWVRCEIITGLVFCCFQVNMWTGSCAEMPSFPCLCCVRCPVPKTVCSVPGPPGLCVPTPAQGRTQRASRPEHVPFWPTMQVTVRVYTIIEPPLYSFHQNCADSCVRAAAQTRDLQKSLRTRFPPIRIMLYLVLWALWMLKTNVIIEEI